MNSDDLISVRLACPHCGASGNVQVDQLNHVYQCGQCTTQFWLAKDGTVRTDRSSRKRVISCPRCLERESVSGELLSGCGQSGWACRCCGHRYRVNGSSEAKGQAGSNRTTATQSLGAKSSLQGSASLGSGLTRKAIVGGITLSVLVALSVLVGLGLGTGSVPSWGLGWLVGGGSSGDLRSSVVAFTRSCFTGEHESAQKWVRSPSSEHWLQWRLLRFPPSTDLENSLNKIPGDFSIQVTRLQRRGDTATVRVIVLSQRQRQLHTQVWRRQPAGWRFAPEATLVHLRASLTDD